MPGVIAALDLHIVLLLLNYRVDFPILLGIVGTYVPNGELGKRGGRGFEWAGVKLVQNHVGI